MGLLAQIFNLSGPTHDGPPVTFFPSLGGMVPMIPNLFSSTRVLGKRALVLKIKSSSFR
jgi:hypothetical protein